MAGFLVDVFRISDPNESSGSRVTAGELPDAASREIETGLAKEPAVQGKLLWSMSRPTAGSA